VIDGMYFNVELPADPASAVIPITLGCNCNFIVNQIITGDIGDEQSPMSFLDGDSVTMTIEISRSQTCNIDATLVGSEARFVIPVDTCESAAHSVDLADYQGSRRRTRDPNAGGLV
jgi:hypothetical protein